jgi:alpha-1,3-mannosyl-glycoprotein beta-1,2-N-acetylglucosaminyltransferase
MAAVQSIGKRHVRRIAFILIFTLAWAWIAAVIVVLWHTTKQHAGGKLLERRPIENPLHHQLAGDEPEEGIVQPRGRTETNWGTPNYESPTLVFTCSRAQYLDQTLADIVKYIPTACDFGCPIIVSQDGDDEAVKTVIQKYQRQNHGIPIVHIQHEKPHSHVQINAYQALAVHYGWALTETFSGKAYAADSFPLPQRVIILEEDLHIAPDFFHYFQATAPLLDVDSTLMAVSAFNDNGQDSHVRDASRILRSDFFPGLGWMMTRTLWDGELSSKWPSGYWDDWLREPAQRQGRHFLRPEISRTFHFGVKGGASSNQFGGSHAKMLLNQEKVNWKSEDLTYLFPAAFDQEYWDLVSTATVETDIEVAMEESKVHNVRIEYKGFPEFKKLAHNLNLMDDEKAGVPRTAYKGIVETRPHGDHILFVSPPLDSVKKELQQSR